MVISLRELDNDASLVSAAQAGDPDAFAELFRRHHDSVRRSCARRLGDIREADEIAQAAFVRAWERIDRCGGERRFGGWIQVIAHHLCIDAIRDRARVSLSDSTGDDAQAPIAEQPEDSVLRSEEANLVKLALADLPPRQRRVVVARHLEDRRPGEIAAALGLSVGAVDSLLLRGRRRLAAAVERLSDDHGTISAASASSVAAGVAGSSGRVADFMQSIQETFSRVSYHVAAAFGMVPGVSGPVQRAAAAVAITGAAATGVVAHHAAPALPSVPPVAVSAPDLAATPAIPAAPEAPLPSIAAPTAPRLDTGLPSVDPVTVPSVPATPSLSLPVINRSLDAVTTLLDELGGALGR
ncbi:MAG TPA: RNA polymerase sigma factor [Acidimicrobiales bacterium]|nr:RNA polymerase sigma factor [Acidimicrobiales bacterium]